MGSVDLLLGRVLAAIAAGAALAGSGCTTRHVVEEGGASDAETGESGSTTASDGASDGDVPVTVSTGGPDPTGEESITVSTSDDDGTTTNWVKFDIGEQPDHGDQPPPIPPRECADPPPADFGCDVRLSPHQVLVYRCMDVPPEGCEALDQDVILQDAWLCYSACDGGFEEVACGPDPGELDACCYWLVWEEGQFCPGRPFVVGGETRLAATRGRDDWNVPVALNVADLDGDSRARLGAAWLEHARYEHASVASFARFVLQLLAVGAPARLVAQAQQAMAEELEHARTFYALASAHAGQALGPGPLPIEGSLGECDLRSVTLATVREGCIAETISALQIAVAAERARDVAVAETLRRIADEELRHAELAWAFVRWALEHGDDALRLDVASIFQNAGAYVPAGPDLEGDETLLEHGLLPRSVRLELAVRALAGVVGPATASLLSECSVGASGVDSTDLVLRG